MSSATSLVRRLSNNLSAESLQRLIKSSFSTHSYAALTTLQLLQDGSSDLTSSSHPLSHTPFSEHNSQHNGVILSQRSTPCTSGDCQIFQSSAQQHALRVRSMMTVSAARSFTAIYQPVLINHYSTHASENQNRPSVQQASSSSVPSSVSSTDPIPPTSSCSKDNLASPVPSSEGGAASNPWINTPNLLSMGRAVSGPVIAYLIMEDQWVIAISALAVSGATDWLDGYMARKLNQSSVVGSYLDPLADKVLIGSVALALAAKALMPWWIAAAIVGRDVGLVGGMFIHRAHMLGWRWPGASIFFSTQDVPAAPTAHSSDSHGTAGANPLHTGSTGSPSGDPGKRGNADYDTGSITSFMEQQSGRYQSNNSTTESGGDASLPHSPRNISNSSPEKAGVGDGGVPYMKPLLISKVNTVLQLALVGAYISKAQIGWPDDQALHLLVVLTVSTTVWTCVRYAHKYFTGRLFQQTL